jgi:alginate O-acetyltransferase complex protein AlgI
MTYCLDIARGSVEPARYFFVYIEYLLVFPQIIAGPIVKYNQLAPQIGNKNISFDNIELGFRKFTIGLFKKVLIADFVSKYADLAFNGPANAIPVQYAWIGLICYTFQIYFDFSAYSDMAIGLLKIMGFNIPINFNNPYISKNITEFWKRWHISLTSWMREYVYIPLGGNRRGKTRTYFNLWVVFLISGIWHGASWNFIIWGIYHGSLLCLEKTGFFRKISSQIPDFVKTVSTVFFVMIGWVFFRADNLKNAFGYLKQLFNLSSANIHTSPERIMVIDNYGKFIILIASLLCILPMINKPKNKITAMMAKHNNITLGLHFLLFFVSVIKVGTASFSPFIYFRF